MKRFLELAILAVVLTLFLPPAWAGRHHQVSVNHHGYYHGSRSYVGYGYYGGPYYWPFYTPYAWNSAGYYYAPEPAWRVARYRNATGAVEADIRPKKAQVSLDGMPVGQARDFNGPWDLLVLPKGTHTVAFSAPGYMTLRMVLDVKSGGYYHFTDRLMEGEGLDPRSDEPAPAVQEAEIAAQEEPAPEKPNAGLRSGLLHVSVQPADAAVYLDGEFLAKGEELSRLHGAIPVARGEHILEVLRPGYQAQTVTVVVDGDKPARVQVELQPDD